MNDKIKLLFLISILFFVSVLKAELPSERYNAAMNLFNNAEYSKAQSLFLKIISDGTVDQSIKATAQFYSAESYFLSNDYDAAVSTFENFIGNYFSSSLRDRALYRLGTIYFNNDNFAKAKDRLFELVNNHRSSEFYGSALYIIGESYVAEKQYTQALRYLSDAAANESTNQFLANSIYSLGNTYEQLGEFEKAVEQYDEILSYYRESDFLPLAQLRIGASYFNLRKYDNAVIELSDPRIKELRDEKESEALMLLANSFLKLREYENAKGIFNELISKNPDLSNEEDIEFALAKINFQSGNYEDAYDSFVKLLAATSDSIATTSLYLAAESKRYSGKESEAQDLYKNFLDNYPNHYLSEHVALNLATSYYMQGMTNRAVQYLADLGTSSNQSIQVKALTLLGEIEFNGNNYQKALDLFSAAIDEQGEVNEQLYDAVLGKGISQYHLDQFQNSVETLQELNSASQNYQRSKTNFYLAEAKFALGDFQSAVTYYNRVNIDASSVGTQTLFGKAYAYYNLRDYANAIYYFNEFISRARDSERITEAKLRLADSFYGTKNFERSSQIYSEVFSDSKQKLDNDYALYQFGQALFYSDKTNQAISRFRELQNRFPRSSYVDESQYLIGWINFKNSNFNDAISEYKIMLNKYPNSPIVPIALYSIGDSYFNLAEYDSSVAYYNRLIENHQNSPYVFDAVNGIQYAYIAKDQPEYAVAFLKRFVLLNPNSSISDKVKFMQGDVHFSLGEYDKAREAYGEFINQFPNSKLIPEAHYWMGKCYELLGVDLEAIDNFKLVVDKYLNSEVGIDAAIELGNTYKKLNMNNQAIDLYDSVLDKIGNNKRAPELLFAKAEILIETENLADAYETLDFILNYYDGTLFADKAKVELGVLELERGGYENAEILFSELGAKRTDDIGAKAQYYYGVTLFEQEKLNQAISAFVRVRSVFGAYDEWFTKSLLKLGDTYVKLDDKKNARDMYRAVISKHKNDDYGREAQQKLNNLMKKLLAIILLPLFVAAQSQQSQSIELPEFVITGQQKISLPIMKKSKAKPVQLFSKDVKYQTFTLDQFSLTTVSMPVRQPALLFKETKSYNNHLVLGAGQYTLPTGRFYFSQPFSNAKLYANLKGVNIKDYEEYADYNRSYINLGSEFYISRTSSFLPYAIIGVDAEFDRREFHFYSNLRQPGSTPARRELQRGKAKISLSNYADDIFDYQFTAGGNYLNIMGTNIEEILFDIKADTRIKYSDFSLLLGGEYKLQQLDKNLLNENYNFVFAKGALEYHLNSKMKIFAGAKYYLADVREVVNPLFINPMSKQNESLIYPFGGLDYSVSNMLSINVKYDPYAVYSTINDFLNKNRFTFVGNKLLDHSSFILFDNNLKKVNHHINASLKFGYKKYYEVTVGATFSKIDNQSYFTNDYTYNPTIAQPEFFYVDRVSDVTGYSLYANALYHLGPFGWFYGDAKFEVLETSSNKRIPYKPLLSLDAAYGYKFDFGLSAEIKVKYRYKYYGDIANSGLLDDYINLSSELKYSLTGNFDLTLQLNNLLNRDQELWSGYLEPPFDIIAGFDFRF